VRVIVDHGLGVVGNRTRAAVMRSEQFTGLNSEVIAATLWFRYVQRGPLEWLLGKADKPAELVR
jgi:hypothetical protein